jgi:hypothetical protein
MPPASLLFGFIFLLGSVFPLEPSRDQLSLIDGVVQRASVVNDWYGRAKRIEFELKGSDLVYWTDRLPHELMSPSSTENPVRLQFHIQTDGAQPKKTLAGTVKTYGLSVNGRQIISVDEYLEGETALRHLIMAPLGAVLITIGGVIWFRRRRRGVESTTA